MSGGGAAESHGTAGLAEAPKKNPSLRAFFATERECVNALLRRCFTESKELASACLKAALIDLFGENWHESVSNAVSETLRPFVITNPEGPWDTGIVFSVFRNYLPAILQRSRWNRIDDPKRMGEVTKLVENVSVVDDMRNIWAHTPLSVKGARIAAQSLFDALFVLPLAVESIFVPIEGLSALKHTLELMNSSRSTVEWTLDDVAFVVLQRGFSALCESSRAVVFECRKQRVDSNHVKYCYVCRRKVGLCSGIPFCELRRGVTGVRLDEVCSHLSRLPEVTCACSEAINRCVSDVGPLISHFFSCTTCMPCKPDKELHLVKQARNYVFHSSNKEIVSLALSALMCVEIVMKQLHCHNDREKMMIAGKVKSVQNMQEQLQSFAQFPDAQFLVGAFAKAIQSRAQFHNCSSMPVGASSAFTDYDAVKHVLFGTVPSPSSGCSCFKSVTSKANLDLSSIKVVLEDFGCLSSVAYTEVRKLVLDSQSLREVCQKLHSRFVNNAERLNSARIHNQHKQEQVIRRSIQADVRFCHQLRIIAGDSSLDDVPSDALGIESLLCSAGKQLSRQLSTPGLPLCAFAQALVSGRHLLVADTYWLLLQHVVFSLHTTYTEVNCSCMVKQHNQDARLLFVKEKLKRLRGLSINSDSFDASWTDTFGNFPNAVVHLAELAQAHGATLSCSRNPIRVRLQDASVNDFKFKCDDTEPVFVAHHTLVDRYCGKMGAAVNTPHLLQLLVLSGVDGVGKTYAAARVFRELHLMNLRSEVSEPLLMQRISGKSAASVMRDFVKFGRTLNRQLHLDEDEVVARLIVILRNMRYAIFLDDASEQGMSELLRLLPVSNQGGAIVATSNIMDAQVLQDIAAAAGASQFFNESMTTFNSEDIMQYLRVSEVDPVFLADNQFLQLPSSLPLWLALFSRWIRSRNSVIPISGSVLKSLQVARHELPMTSIVQRVLDDMKMQEATFHYNRDAVMQLLATLALCPDSVSWSLFDGKRLLENSDGICTDLQSKDSLRDIALLLQQHGLITVDVNQRMLCMHPLIQEAVYVLCWKGVIDFNISDSTDTNLQLFRARPSLMNYFQHQKDAVSILSLILRVMECSLAPSHLPLFIDTASTCCEIFDVIMNRMPLRDMPADLSHHWYTDIIGPFCEMREFIAQRLTYIGSHNNAFHARFQIVHVIRGATKKTELNLDILLAPALKALASSYYTMDKITQAQKCQRESCEAYARRMESFRDHDDMDGSLYEYKCESLITEMQHPPHALSPSLSTWTILFNAYRKLGDTDKIVKTLERMVLSCITIEFGSWNDKDIELFLTHVSSSDWKQSSLPPADNLFSKVEDRKTRCFQILEYIRAVIYDGKTRISRIRVMMVGLGEVGKTRLVRALQNEHTGFKSEGIPKENRTIAADIRYVLLNPTQKTGPLTACIWDFAGQEVYYMAHSLFMSSRAVYVLVWKRPDDPDDENDFRHAKAGMRRWLEMISLHVPNAKIVVVGTHCQTPGSDKANNYEAHFAMYNLEIKSHVKTVVKDLNAAIRREDQDLKNKSSLEGQSEMLLHRRAFLRGIPKAHTPTPVEIASRDVCQMRIDDHSFFAVDSATGTGVIELSSFLDKIGRELTANDWVPRSYSLIEKCFSQPEPEFGEILSKTEAINVFQEFYQREKQHELMKSLKFNGSSNHQLEHKYQRQESRQKDSNSSQPAVVVPAKRQKEGTDPKIKEAVAFWDALGTVFVDDDVRLTSPAPITEMIEYLLPSPISSLSGPVNSEKSDANIISDIDNVDVEDDLDSEDDLFSSSEDIEKHDHRIASAMSPEKIWQGFLYWHDLGTMFVSVSANGLNDIVVPDPEVLLDFIKPLVHPHPLNFLEAFYKDSQYNFLAPCTHQRGEKENDDEIERIANVLAMLSSESCFIKFQDLHIFKKWTNLENDDIRREVLALFRKELIVDFEESNHDGLNDFCITVTARIHTTPGFYQPVDLPFFFVYLLPIDNVALLVHLRKAFSMRMKGIVFPFKLFFARCDRSTRETGGSEQNETIFASVMEIQRNRVTCCQIIIQPSSFMNGDDFCHFGHLEKIASNSSCVLRLSCSDRSFLSLAISCISDALSVAYPFCRIPYWMSTKHIDIESMSHVPWLKMSDLKLKECESLSELISNAKKFGNVQVTGSSYLAVTLSCESMFPQQPLINMIVHKSCSTFVEYIRFRLECDFAVPVDLHRIDELKKSVAPGPVFIVCLTPLFLCNPHCMASLQHIMALCNRTSNRRLCIVSMHPSVTYRGIVTIIQKNGIMVLNDNTSPASYHQCRRLNENHVSLLKNLLRMNHDQDDVTMFFDQWCLFAEQDFVNLGNAWPMFLEHILKSLQCHNPIQEPVEAVATAIASDFEWEYVSQLDILAEYSSISQFYDRDISNGNDIFRGLIHYGFSANEIQKCLTIPNLTELSSESRSSFENVHTLFNQSIDFVRQKYAAYPSLSSKSSDSSSDASASFSRFSSGSLVSGGLTISLCLEGDGVAALFSVDDKITSTTIDCLVSKICEFSSSLRFRLSSTNMSLFNIHKVSNTKVVALFLVDEFEGSFAEFYDQTHHLFESIQLGNACGDVAVKLQCTNNSEELVFLQSVLQQQGVYILPPYKVRRGAFGQVFKCSYQDPRRRGSRRHVIRAAKVCDMSSINTNPMYDEGLLLDYCEKCDYVVTCYAHFDIPANISPQIPAKRVILMEWLEIGDLRGLFSQISKSPQTRHLMNSDIFQRFSEHILDGVSFLHKVDSNPNSQKPLILHRDIKPENILIKFEDSRHHGGIDLSKVVLKLTDFGLAKAIEFDHVASSNGNRKGTPYYKSPELWAGQYSCQGDDVWSTALVLVEMLCGGQCIHPQPENEKSILISEIGNISGVDHEVIKNKCLPWLRIFLEPVLAALRKDKKIRCTNPKELLAALKNCKHNENRMHDVFLCYHPDDANFARNLEAQMSDNRLKVHRASPGIRVTELCLQLLNEAAIFSHPFLKSSLQKLHNRVFDFCDSDSREVLNSILKDGPGRHCWDEKRVFKVTGNVIISQKHRISPGSRIKFAGNITRVTEDSKIINPVPKNTFCVLDLGWTQDQFQVSVLGSRKPVSIEVDENTLLMSASFDVAALKDFLRNKDEISIAELHRLISDKAAEFHCIPRVMKLANANMQKIAHPEEGWVELGRMFTSSSGGHEAAIQKTDVGNLDVEAVFNILKHLKSDGIVEEQVRDCAERLVQFRHTNQGHKETRHRTETPICEFLKLRSIIQSLVHCLSDHEDHPILSYSDQFDREIQETIVKDIRIMLNSRNIVPVISQAAIDAWSTFDEKCTQWDPALVYVCAAFAARTIAFSSRFMASRVERILPIISFSHTSPNTIKIASKRGRCLPEFMYHNLGNDLSASPIFKDSPYLQFEQELKYGRIDRQVHIICENHCLSPGMCITFTEKVIVDGTQVCFVLAQGLNPGRFQVSASLESTQPLCFVSDKSTIGFKLASYQLFNSFRSKHIKDIWRMLNEECQCYLSQDMSEIDFTDGANFLKTHLKTLDFDTQEHDENCVCRFEILESNCSSADSAESSIESVYYRPMTDTRRLKVRLISGYDAEPRSLCNFHALGASQSVVGTCLWAHACRDSLHEVHKVFDVEMVINYGTDQRLFEKSGKLCSCSYSRHPNDQIGTYKTILQKTIATLRQSDIKNQIIQAKKEFKSQEVVRLKSSIFETLKNSAIDIWGADIKIDELLQDCSLRYRCVWSIREKLDEIHDLDKLTTDRNFQFEELLLSMNKELLALSQTDCFKQACIGANTECLQVMLDYAIEEKRRAYCGNYDDDLSCFAKHAGCLQEFNLLRQAQNHLPSEGILSMIENCCLFVRKLQDLSHYSNHSFPYLLFKTFLEGEASAKKLIKCHEFKMDLIAPLLLEYKKLQAKMVALSAGDTSGKMKNILAAFKKMPSVAARDLSVPAWIDDTTELWKVECVDERCDAKWLELDNTLRQLVSCNSNSDAIQRARQAKNSREKELKSLNVKIDKKWQDACRNFALWLKTPIDPDSLTLIHIESATPASSNAQNPASSSTQNPALSNTQNPASSNTQNTRTEAASTSSSYSNVHCGVPGSSPFQVTNAHFLQALFESGDSHTSLQRRQRQAPPNSDLDAVHVDAVSHEPNCCRCSVM